VDPNFANLFGITLEDLKANKELMNRLGLVSLRYEKETKKPISLDDVLEELVKNYNGFQFSHKKAAKVFSPFSLLKFLKYATDPEYPIAIESDKIDFPHYWFSSGTSSSFIYAAEKMPLSFYIEIEKKKDSDIISFLSNDLVTDSCMITDYPLNYYLQTYQTGYLTIDNFNPNSLQYGLRFPNKEVKDAWYNAVTAHRRRVFKANVRDYLIEEDWKEVDFQIIHWLKKHEKRIKEAKKKR